MVPVVSPLGDSKANKQSKTGCSLLLRLYSLCTQSMIDPWALCVIGHYISAVTSPLSDEVVVVTQGCQHLTANQVVGERFRGATSTYPRQTVFMHLHESTQAVCSKKSTLRIFFKKSVLSVREYSVEMAASCECTLNHINTCMFPKICISETLILGDKFDWVFDSKADWPLAKVMQRSKGNMVTSRQRTATIRSFQFSFRV